MAIAFALLFGAAGQVAGANYRHQLDDHRQRVAAHTASVSKYRDMAWFDSGGLYLNRPPERLSTISRGVEGSYGSVIRIARLVYPNFSGGMADSPLVAAFAPVDYVFIVRLVASLCALLLAFDAMSSERESGTVKLLLCSSASRLALYVGKLSGNVVSVLIPLSLGGALGLLFIQRGASFEFNSDELLRLGTIWSTAALYIVSFVALGLGVSIVARSSMTSLTACIITWLGIVILVPPVMAASTTLWTARPNLAAADAEVELIKQDASQVVMKKLMKIVETTRRDVSIPTIYMTNRDEARRRLPLVQQIRQDFDMRQRHFDRRAHDLTMLSPAGALTHVMTRLSLTSIADFERYIDAAREYRIEVLSYYDRFEDRRTPFHSLPVPPFTAPRRDIAGSLFDARLPLLLLVAWATVFMGFGLTSLYAREI